MLSPPKAAEKSRAGTSSGSATGNPRNKVALQPGHSLMDWIRLGHSGKDLTGVGGAMKRVTPAELSTHNKPTDCWLAIRGTVYNVSHYMDFHPGGPEKLMEGAGQDATEIFDKIHAYVNYNSILQKCVVGPLSHTSEHDVGSLFAETKTRKSTDLNQPLPKESISSQQSTGTALPMDWYQKDDTIHLVLYTKVSNPQILVQLKPNKELLIFVIVNHRAILSHITLFNKVKWPCQVFVSDVGKVEVELSKAERTKWNIYGKPCRDNGTVLTTSIVNIVRKMKIVDTIEVAHNTRLLILRYEDQLHNSIPIGHHLLVHYSVEGTALVRMYTPVPPMLHADHLPASWSSECVCLMVKSYPLGAVSPWLYGLKPHDVVEAGGPEGTFGIQLLRDCTHLHLIAAGTGITPMLGLIRWALDNTRRKCKSVSLMFFNKTLADILWKDQMEDLLNTDNRFSVTNVLSEPDAGWTGTRGQVSLSLLRTFLPDPTSESIPESCPFTCVCGPVTFTQLVGELLETIGYTHSQYHCFMA